MEMILHNTDFETFENWMENHILTFKYRKKDGSVREAKGTTCNFIIPAEHHPKESVRNYSDKNFRYFDTDKREWRSFLKENLIEFV
jgi:hypothetical protein